MATHDIQPQIAANVQWSDIGVLMLTFRLHNFRVKNLRNWKVPVVEN